MDKEKLVALTSDYQQVFSSPAGKNVLRHLMKTGGVLTTSFVAGDPYTSAYNEGQRAFMLAIIKRLRIDIKQLEKDLMANEPEGDDNVSI